MNIIFFKTRMIKCQRNLTSRTQTPLKDGRNQQTELAETWVFSGGFPAQNSSYSCPSYKAEYHTCEKAMHP